MKVAALFVRSDSVYWSMPGVDCFDVERNALTWSGGCPVVAHPPCRLWSRLAPFAKCGDSHVERYFGVFAARMVRLWGGVLEHPARSWLFCAAGLPSPGVVDEFGGFTVPVTLYDFGARVRKPTWVYVCRPTVKVVPPLRLGEASHTVGWSSRARITGGRYRPGCSKRENEATPPPMAQWLVEIAGSCQAAGRSNTGQSLMDGTHGAVQAS